MEYTEINEAFYGEPNFDLKKEIEGFTFTNLIKNALEKEAKRKRDGKNRGNGAVLVITDKQYVLTYNYGFGLGHHMPAFARVYKELHGGGEIEESTSKINDLSSTCKREYICARILFENEAGGLFFENISQKTINHMNYQQFLKFYEENNEEIKRVSNNNSGFYVSFHYVNEAGEKVESRTKDLDALKEYFESKLKNITEDVPTSSDDEVILSEKYNLSNTKNKLKSYKTPLEESIDHYEDFLEKHDLSHEEDQKLKLSMEEKLKNLKEKELILYKTESLIDNIIEEYNNSDESSFDKTKQFVERFSFIKRKFIADANLTNDFKKSDRYKEVLELFSRFPDINPYISDPNKKGKMSDRLKERDYYDNLSPIIKETIQKKDIKSIG